MSTLEPTQIDAFRRALQGWYRDNARPLPWRAEPSPYRVWISEIMAQQTQIATVIPYYHRFLAAFPDVATLADADEQQVLTLWSGLGYYRRARQLHAAAKAIVRLHDGRVPDTVTTLRGLPGIGRYTAGAIASQAFGKPAPIVDGNVARVLSRVVALADPINASAGESALWNLAETLLDRTDPGNFNQALMELGALVCRKANPACDGCPLAPHCRAHALGQTAEFPKKRAKPKPTPVHAVCAAIQRGGQLLLARRPNDGLLAGLWELPGGVIDKQAAPIPALQAHLRQRLGLDDVSVIGPLGQVIHVFTHRRMALTVFAANLPGGATASPRDFYTDCRWQALEGPTVPLSRLTNKVLAVVRDT